MHVVFKIGNRTGGFQEGSAYKVRRNLLEHCKPFAGDAGFVERWAGHIAARLRKAGNESRADRVGGASEHDRNRAVCSWRAAATGVEFARITSGCRAISSFANTCAWVPPGAKRYRCGHYGLQTIHVFQVPGGIPRGGLLLQGGPRQCPSARRSAARGRPAVRAQQAAKPPRHQSF
jgi:hypothetical protein